ncbi:MAG: dipeptidase, partial [Holophagales bacterium]|nr:dipeptidase [Holophagales bacterium]
VDISHVSDAAFFQVMEIARAPAIATHSSARHFTPGFERNMSDEMIQALAENGGVIHINFGSSFLTEEANSYGDTHRPVIREYLETNNLEWGSPEAEAWMAEYRQQNPYPYATVDDVVAHIDHVVKLVGIDHVGLGSDYDGVGDTLPEGLTDASTFPNLIAALLDKGYTEEDIEKILSGNLMRVWREVEKVAAELRASAEAA